MRRLLPALWLLAALPAWCASPGEAKPRPAASAGWALLLRPADVDTVRLSGDGERLLVTSEGGGRGLVTLLVTADLKPVQQWRLPVGRYAHQTRWVGTREFVYRSVSGSRYFGGYSLGPLNVVAEGRDTIDVIAMAPYERAIAVVPGEHPALMASGIEKGRDVLYRIDLRERTRALVATGPGQGGKFIVDAQGAPRYYFGQDHRLENVVLERRGDDWEVLHRSRGTQSERVPERMARDGRRVWFREATPGGTFGLHLYDPATDRSTRVSSDPRYDVADHIASADGGDVVAVAYEGDRPRFHFPGGAHPDAKVYKQLMRAFPDHALQFIDITADGNRILFRAYDDRDPGQIYLFDRDRGEARFLMAVRPWIDPERMATQTPLRFAARDGVQIDAYLWTPPGSDGKRLPLVVRPHGGPHGYRDVWGFDEEAQVLAAGGYAVLAVNFRGSGGYGPAFEKLGYRAWGRTMIDDITDATHHVVARGIADPARICVFGTSYGGYAALMSVVREPKLYRCAAGMAGVYDLRAAFRHDHRSSDWLGNYFEDVFPEQMSEREWQSPSHRAAEIEVPVLLAHGTEDPRVPIDQYRRMWRALREAGNPAEEMLVQGEGHGFHAMHNRARFYTALLRFLDQHIGARDAAARKD